MKGYINSNVKESVEKKVMEVEVRKDEALVPVSGDGLGMLTIDGVDCYEKDGVAYLRLESHVASCG